MRRRAGLDTDKARRQLLEESSDVTPLQLAPDDHMAFRVNAMDLKNRLCDVETNRRDSLHGPSPPNQVTPLATTVRGTHVPVEEPSTASKAEVMSRPIKDRLDHPNNLRMLRLRRGLKAHEVRGDAKP